MDDSAENIIRNIQASVHDQINAMKSDLQDISSDLTTVVDIASELEQNINSISSDILQLQPLSEVVKKIISISVKGAEQNELNFSKLRILSVAYGMYLRISILNLVKLRICAEEPDQMYLCIQPIFKLLDFHDNMIKRIKSAKNNDELQSISNDIANKIIDVQNELNTQNIKLIDGSISNQS